jgi:arabinofuranosyltransferase
VPSPSAPSRRRVTLVGAVSLVLVALAVAWGLWRAIVLAWLSDDGFISFRYAEHLVSGHGLVYNVGERVEGYTNLLWTLLIAAAMALGIAPEASSHVLGILFWLALVAVLAWRSWRPAAPRSFVPLAAALVLLMGDYQTWATGGLETSLFTLLAVTGVLLASRANASVRGLALAGVLLAAAVATRPDGVIFAAVAVAGTGWVQAGAMPRQRVALLTAILLPLALAGAALVAWKLAYYGDLFPTAFYAKSALDPYHAQDWYYIYLFLKKNWFIAPLTLVLLAGSLVTRGASGLVTRRHIVLLAAGGLFLAYVAHSGGDFMFARRVLPALPLVFVVLEDWLVALPGRLLPATAVALTALGVLAPYPVYTQPGQRLRGIADEPSFYPPALMEARRVQALVAAQALAGLPVRAALEGGMCVFGYYSRLPYLVEMTGLTQYSLAKTPLMARGHVGHEKTASDDWLTEHNIHFVFSHLPPPISRGGPLRVDEIAFGDALKARIWTYDEALMSRLRRDPRVAFTPIEVTLREAERHIAAAPYDEARRIYAVLERYYFRGAGPAKQAQADALRRQVEARRPPGTR